LPKIAEKSEIKIFKKYNKSKGRKPDKDFKSPSQYLKSAHVITIVPK